MNWVFALSLTFGIAVALSLAGLIVPSGHSLAARLNRLSEYPSVSPSRGEPSSPAAVLKRLKISWRSQHRKKIDRAVMELGDLIDLISTSLAAGESIYSSLSRVARRGEGEIANSLKKILAAVELGASLPSEILRLPELVPHPQVNEFASKIALSLNRGTPLAQMLKDQSQSVRAEIRARLLREGGRNETRMLIPLVFLILPITVLFAIYPSLRLLNFSFL